jgi:multidrug efflux pump
MENVAVQKAVLLLAAPTILSQCMSLFYQMVSTYCLGRMGDSYQIAAVTLSMPVNMGIMAIGNIFASGTPPSMSRKLGAKDFEGARQTSAVSFYSALIISVASTILFFFFREPILHLIGTSENTIGPTRTYLSIVTSFGFTQVLMIALSGTLRSEGATKLSMIGIGGGAIVNSILTPLFIFVFHMGIAGAAWATVGANAYSLLFFLSVFIRGKSKLSISPRDFKPNWEIYSNILKFGVPMACNNVLQSFAGILSNRVGAGFGDYVVAGYGISHRLYQITYSLNFGFCLGYQPFAAYNYGAGNYKRLLSAFKVSLIYSTCIGSFMAVIFAVFPKAVMGVFTTDRMVIDVGAKMLLALALAAPFLGCQNTFMYTLQGVDMPSRSMIISIGRQGLHIPFILLFSNLFGLTGYMFAQPTAELILVLTGALLTIPIVMRIRKDSWQREKKTAKQEAALEEEGPEHIGQPQ